VIRLSTQNGACLRIRELNQSRRTGGLSHYRRCGKKNKRYARTFDVRPTNSASNSGHPEGPTQGAATGPETRTSCPRIEIKSTRKVQPKTSGMVGQDCAERKGRTTESRSRAGNQWLRRGEVAQAGARNSGRKRNRQIGRLYTRPDSHHQGESAGEHSTNVPWSTPEARGYRLRGRRYRGEKEKISPRHCSPTKEGPDPAKVAESQ